MFKTYTSVESIAAVWRRIQSVQGTLRGMLDEDFDSLCVFPTPFCVRSCELITLNYSELAGDSFLVDATKPIKPSTITDACSVVDVLGEDVRYALLNPT
jgi:vacuolar protein sorting-associated protein 53